MPNKNYKRASDEGRLEIEQRRRQREMKMWEQISRSYDIAVRAQGNDPEAQQMIGEMRRGAEDAFFGREHKHGGAVLDLANQPVPIEHTTQTSRLRDFYSMPGQSQGFREAIDPITWKLKPEKLGKGNYWAGVLEGVAAGTGPKYPANIGRGITQAPDVQAGYEKAVTEYGGDPRLETRNIERDPAMAGQRAMEFLTKAGKYAGEERGWEDPNTGNPIPVSGMPRQGDPSMALWEQGLGGLSPEELEQLKRLFGFKGR